MALQPIFWSLLDAFNAATYLEVQIRIIKDVVYHPIKVILVFHKFQA